MKTVWLLELITSKSPRKYFVCRHRQRPVLTEWKARAQHFQSEHHANSQLSYKMKHEGYVARQHSIRS